MAQRPSPGSHLQTQYLFPPRRTPAWLAEQMGVPLSTVEGVLNGSVAVDGPLAKRLAAALGTSAQLWLDLQEGRGPSSDAGAVAGPRLPRSLLAARGALVLFTLLTLFPLTMDIGALQSRDIGYAELLLFIVNLPLGLAVLFSGMLTLSPREHRRTSLILWGIALALTALGPALLWLGHLMGYKEGGC